MAKKKEPEVNPYIIPSGFKNQEPPPQQFPVKDPAVLKGIRDSVQNAEKGRAQQTRFKAWGAGIDYDKTMEARNGDA